MKASSVKNCIEILSEHINYTIEYAFTVIDCLMNQINGIAERSAVAFSLCRPLKGVCLIPTLGVRLPYHITC